MSSFTSAILAGLQFSEAEKAFRPWWDRIEDFTVYALFLLVTGVPEKYYETLVYFFLGCFNSSDVISSR